MDKRNYLPDGFRAQLEYDFLPLVLKRSKHYTQAMRDNAEAHGHAMPGGRFPIANTADLARAKHAFGRAKNKPAVRRWINQRARALGAAPLGGDVGKSLFARRSSPPAYSVEITKAHELKDGLVWGWASIIEKDGVPIIDHQGDMIDEDELVKTAHDYVTSSRVGGALHLYAPGPDKAPLKGGDIVESLVFTKDLQKALGIDLGKVGWLIGYKVTDPYVRKMFAAGHLKAFSIGGSGRREPF